MPLGHQLLLRLGHILPLPVTLGWAMTWEVPRFLGLKEAPYTAAGLGAPNHGLRECRSQPLGCSAPAQPRGRLGALTFQRRLPVDLGPPGFGLRVPSGCAGTWTGFLTDSHHSFHTQDPQGFVVRFFLY